jgi:hypothetical protein
MPRRKLNKYEFNYDGTEQLWNIFLLDVWYAVPNDMGDEIDVYGLLKRHKRAKERRLDILDGNYSNDNGNDNDNLVS